MIRSILFVVFILIMGIGLVVLIAVNSSGNKKNYVNENVNKRSVSLISGTISAISLVSLLLVPSSFHQVEVGTIAVVKSLGKVVGTREPGTYFDFYLTHDYILFDTTVQKLEVNTVSYSSDAQTMDISMTIQYKIDSSKVVNILTEYVSMKELGKRIEKVADDKVKSVLSQYTAMEIIETRAAISPEVEDIIKNAVGDKYYAEVTAVNLTNIDFTDEFEKAVEDKVVAEQQKEAAITKAEQELEVAKLQAQAKIEEARGDAESQKIIASATAEAMAIKIVELARSLGFTVDESYITQTTTVIRNKETNDIISDLTIQEEVTNKPAEGVVTTDDVDTVKIVTTAITNTKYSIKFDAEHTKEDLQIILDFIQYIEYLEKWDGELPEVVTGSDGVDIIVPTNPSTSTPTPTPDDTESSSTSPDNN